MKVITEIPAKRCEICHQEDCFDVQTQYCSRCSNVNNSLMEGIKRSYTNKLAIKWVLNVIASMIIGGIVGAFIEGANNGLLYFSYISLSSTTGYQDFHLYKMLTTGSILLSVSCVLIIGMIVWPINLLVSNTKLIILLAITFVKRIIIGIFLGLIFAFCFWGIFMSYSHNNTRLGVIIGTLCGLLVILQNRFTQKFNKYYS